ncbi:MAG: hypothetical protein Q9179_005405 [Wetmoreana sp. 5 TL-2023]
MAALGIDTTIFSLTAPGCTILNGAPLNLHVPLMNMQLLANRVTLYTRYGPANNYLGHPSFTPLWEELDRRGCVVFVHPTHTADANLVNPKLPQPIIDYPHKTGRAATDLITSGCMRLYRRTRIVLSHAGGTLPYLATRAATLLHDYKLSGKSAEEFLEDARRFYYDVTLSTNEHTLRLLLGFALESNVLFGTDFPYVPTERIKTHTEMLEGYALDWGSRQRIYRENAVKLMTRLADPKHNRTKHIPNISGKQTLKLPSEFRTATVNGFESGPASATVE